MILSIKNCHKPFNQSINPATTVVIFNERLLSLSCLILSCPVLSSLNFIIKFFGLVCQLSYACSLSQNRVGCIQFSTDVTNRASK